MFVRILFITSITLKSQMSLTFLHHKIEKLLPKRIMIKVTLFLSTFFSDHCLLALGSDHHVNSVALSSDSQGLQPYKNWAP